MAVVTGGHTKTKECTNRKKKKLAFRYFVQKLRRTGFLFFISTIGAAGGSFSLFVEHTQPVYLLSRVLPLRLYLYI